MAITRGHGNPNWTREEVILALELYHSSKGSIPGTKDERVILLSKELRSLPYHRQEAKKQSFRNPAGVAFKLQNIRQVATGHGLGNTSKIDREVWNSFGNNPVATKEAANRIRQCIELVKDNYPYNDDHEFTEGRAVTEVHIRIERDKTIRKKLLNSRKAQDRFSCDICSYNGQELDHNIRESVFEAHHTIPLSGSGKVKTKLRDISLLCANCHRLIHRLMNLEKRWIGIDEARTMLMAKLK